LANTPMNKNTGLVLFLSQQISLTCLSLLYLFVTHRCFLHACTPARRTRALALLFTQREHRQAQRTQNISFKKNGGIPEMVGQRDQRGGASIPHRAKYMGSARCVESMVLSCRLVEFLEVLL